MHRHIDSTAGSSVKGSPFLSSNKATYPSDFICIFASENVPPVVSIASSEAFENWDCHFSAIMEKDKDFSQLTNKLEIPPE